MQLTGQSINLANSDLLWAFVKHTPAAVAMLDRNLCYLLTSQRWLTDYGLEKEELIGRSHYEMFPLLHIEDKQRGADQSAKVSVAGRSSEKLARKHPQHSAHTAQTRSAKSTQHEREAPTTLNTQSYALCLAGVAVRGDSDYVIKPNGLRQRLKWEISPWYNSNGDIGGIIMFTEFQPENSPTATAIISPPSPHCPLSPEGTPNSAIANPQSLLGQLQQEVKERIQAQTREQESEERYRSLIAAMSEGILLEDARHVILTCNQAAEKILGLSAQQLIGKTTTDISWLVVKENGEPFSSEELPINITLKTGQPLTDVIMGLHRPDGTLTWLSVNSQPLLAPNETIPYAAVASFVDITGRKQIEKALRESEERFRATFEQAAVGITHASIDGKFIRVNKKFSEIVGYTCEELLECTFYDITHPDDLPVDLEYVRSLLAGEIATYTLEKRYFRKDGQSIWAQITASRIQPPQGAPQYILRVIEDISVRKATELALQQQAQRELLLNRLSCAIRNSLELNTILETTAQEIREMLQIDRCQFAWYHHHPIRDYWEVVNEARHPELPDRTGRYPADIIGPLTAQLLNLEILKVDDVETVSEPSFKKFIQALGCKSVLSLPMQTPSGTIGAINCIHSSEARPWTESEIELLKAVQDQLFIAIKQADLYAARGRATEQAQEQAMRLEHTLYELQRTQAQLIQVEKMSSLGQLVAGVAHEINNPVNFIYGNLIYAQEYYQDLLNLVQLYRCAYPHPTQSIKDRIDAIDLDFLITDFAHLQDSMKVGAERIREIVRSLRTFSRLDESESKEVDIHTGIDSTLMILQNRFKGKSGSLGMTLIKEYGDLPLVECYAGQLNQVFMNILTNALDALEEQVSGKKISIAGSDSQIPRPSPTITISTGVLDVDEMCSWSPATGNSPTKHRGLKASAKPSHIFIRIADNGPGMTEKTQQQLFNPFFTTKPVGRGTGLGLAISYQIVVEKHGGKLRCNSSPGQGSEFVVEIPIQQEGTGD